jgi:hypothetical protein
VFIRFDARRGAKVTPGRDIVDRLFCIRVQ